MVFTETRIDAMGFTLMINCEFSLLCVCVCVYLCVYVLYVLCGVMHGAMLVGIVVTGWLTCSTYSTHSGRLPYLHLAVCFASIYQNLYCVAVTLYDYTFLLATIVEGVVLRHSIFCF